MMFQKVEEIESVCWQMRQADFPRGRNRALINNLFNGFPPYTAEEEEENEIAVNVNFLEGTRLAHDARMQYYQSILKPGSFFTCTTDAGPLHKNQSYGTSFTKHINRQMKRSTTYVETLRSKFAMLVLHGIAPAGWANRRSWCPEAFGPEDVYVPAGTYLSMVNMPFFVIYRSFTAPELIKLTRGPIVDKGWDRELVDNCIEWIDQQSNQLMNNNWPEIWSAEKVQERLKGDGGFYMGDRVPTINCYDFYFWNDEDKVQGWNRRIILDAWSTPSPADKGGVTTRLKGKPFDRARSSFLFNPGKRKFATDRSQLINWQYADLSSVAPFRYHCVRSLGFLLYAVCDLQNRLRCKFTEAVFEQLMVYFQVSSPEDMERALKVDMINRGFIDASVNFIKAQDRYQVNANLAELGLAQNQSLISLNSASYAPQTNNSPNNVEKTKFQVMAETNAMTSLVSAALNQSYLYQVPEYREIKRRFQIKDSKDADVLTFQANCLRDGIPEGILFNPEAWELEPTRVLGAGNKTMEMAIAEQLMQYRNLYDPEPQRKILRDVTLAITEDPARADSLVPEEPVKVTDSVHDAQLAAGALMQGLPVAMKTGINHIEYVNTMMATLGMIVGKAMQQGTDPSQIQGMQGMAQNISQHIQIIAQDPEEKQRVKLYGDQLGKIMNEVKAMGQQIAEQQAKAQAQGPQPDPETQAKIQSQIMIAKAKAENTKLSHAERTAQRQIAFELEEKRKQQAFQLEMQRESGSAQTAHEMQLASAEAAHGMKLAEHGAGIDSLKAQHQAQLDRAAAERDQLRAEHQMALDRQRTEHEMSLKNQQSEHAMSLKEQETRHRMELAAKAQKSAARKKKNE